MSPRASILVFVGAALLALVSCRRTEAPSDPVWGKQPCAHCAMVIGDRRYAAQALEEDGTTSSFDDLGCLIAYVHARGLRVRRIWVRDESADAWLDAERARFHRGARTPMDYGFAAGRTGELDFAAVKRAVLAREENRS